MTRVALHEPFGTGHGPNALAGLVAAARARGWEVLAISPRPPDIGTTDELGSGPTPRLEWAPCSKHGRPYGATRGHDLNVAFRQALDFRADLFVTLTLDYAINSVRPLRRPPLPSALVLHSSHHLDPSSDRFRSGLRARKAASNLRRLTTAQSVVIVHSQSAEERVGRCVGPERVTQLGWPVASRHTALTSARPTDRRLLFVGNFREEKGFAVLSDALRDTRNVNVLELTSPPPPAHRSVAAGRVESIVAPDAWVDRVQYAQSFERAMVAVLPYTPKHNQSHISAALLDALAHGLPVVVTEPVSPQLPPDYKGAIVVPANDPVALARGIDAAFETHERLEAASRKDGPRFVAEQHSFEGYLDGLCRAAGLPTSIGTRPDNTAANRSQPAATTEPMTDGARSPVAQSAGTSVQRGLLT